MIQDVKGTLAGEVEVLEIKPIDTSVHYRPRKSLAHLQLLSEGKDFDVIEK